MTDSTTTITPAAAMAQLARHTTALKVLAIVMILAGIVAIMQPMLFELFAE